MDFFLCERFVVRTVDSATVLPAIEKRCSHGTKERASWRQYIIKQKYPSLKIVAYVDAISLIGSFDLLQLVAQEIADSYENIGLHLNASKCLLIGSSAQDLAINDCTVLFTNYNSDAFMFLGCWLGNVPQIQNELQVILKKMKIELDSISSSDIEKHIKFFMLKICYTGRITLILRSCAPSIALDFCRSFNSLRTEFFC
ncbi:hypothetical protein P9112_013765 [Eukaryota sp. TZLM1-RC]